MSGKAKKTRPVPTDVKLVGFSGDHLLYELGMFKWAAKQVLLNDRPDDWMVANAVLEVFLLHFRILRDFFHRGIPTKEQLFCDVVAEDYCAGWSVERPDAWDEWKDHLNWRLAHLTYNRPSRFQKTFDAIFGASGIEHLYTGMYAHIKATFEEFKRNASEEKVHPDVMGFAL